MRCDAKKTNEEGSDQLEVAMCATRLDIVELECSFKSAMSSKSRKNIINLV